MKLILLVAVLVTCVLGANLSNQGKMMAQNLREKFKDSHLGNAFLTMVELAGESDADLKDLYDALNKLKENLMDKKDQENTDFQEDTTKHNAEVTRLEGEITKYGDLIDKLTEEIAKLEKDLKGYEEDLKENENALDVAQQAKENEEKYLKKIKEDFEAESIDYDEAVELLGKAVLKLEEAKGEASNAGITVFLETNKESLATMAILIETKFSKMKESPIMIKPIAVLFTQLEERLAEPDHATINRAIKALEDLKDYYAKGKVALIADYENDKKEHEELLKELEKQISTLTDIVIPQLKSNIEDNKKTTEVKEGSKSDAEISKTFEEKNLKDENESYEKRVEINKLLVEEYDKEYKVVVAAEQYLKTQI